MVYIKYHMLHELFHPVAFFLVQAVSATAVLIQSVCGNQKLQTADFLWATYPPPPELGWFKITDHCWVMFPDDS